MSIRSNVSRRNFMRTAAAADDTRHAITTAVRDRVATELARHGNAISAEQVAVQVFGGVL